MARLFACSVCGRIHSRDIICDIKRKRKYEKFKDRTDTGMYNSSKWRSIRNDILDNYNHMCLYTFYKEGRIVKANEVHHIVELLEDEALAYDKDNLIPLSKEQHRYIHELYKHNKKEIQEELRDIKHRWANGDRNIAPHDLAVKKK